MIIPKAYQIAKNCLRKCYTDKGILAGSTHFSDYWARDGCFATFGACELEDCEIVKKELSLLLEYQKEDGQLPLRIGQKSMLLNFLRIKPKEIQPRYTEDKRHHTPKDQNSLLIIALWNYFQKTKDTGFLKEKYEKIKKTIDWYGTPELVFEDWYGGWADSVRKKGKSIYTNILYFKALQDMHSIAKAAGNDSDYLDRANKIKETINKQFWNGYYYADWIDGYKHNNFDSAGNLLAILFGVADKPKAFQILYFIEKEKLDEGFTIRTVYPKYRGAEKSTLLKIVGMDDYHDDVYWLWTGCLNILARQKAGFKFKQQIEKMAEKIVEYDNVYEAYEKEGKPLRRLFYKSEKDFAWSAGMFIYAVHETKSF